MPEVVDLATLRLNERVVRLFGVESRGSSPDELRRYLRGREVACAPQPLSETYRCTVDGQDLSMVVIFNGGGRAAEDSTPELKNAERRARDAKVGLWAGT